jgi:glucosamine--fructose-6-phosphate aminotransferase (isomerizing)
MSHMLSEIRQQPEVIEAVVAAEKERAAELAREVKARGIEYVVICARGTSDNAGIFGKYLFDIRNHMPTGLAAMSTVTLYGSKLKLHKALVVGISQSGQAQDVSEYLAWAREQGALTACITNEAGSRITEPSQYCLLCHAGPEKSVAATKTYTGSLANLYLISASLSGDEEMIESLLAAVVPMRQALEMDDHIRERAHRYRYMEDCFVLARGLNHATAFEGALKISETCRIGANPYSAADFLHGPIAAVAHGFPCILFAPDGKAYPPMLDIAEKLRERGAELVITAHNPEILRLATTAFRAPNVEEIVSPLVYIIVGQLFAYHLSVVRGYDPDHPEGLSKVTLTR